MADKLPNALAVIYCLTHIFVTGCVKSMVIVRLEKLGKSKKNYDDIETQTHDLPAYYFLPFISLPLEVQAGLISSLVFQQSTSIQQNVSLEVYVVF
jgi:hypothetical protein